MRRAVHGRHARQCARRAYPRRSTTCLRPTTSGSSTVSGPVWTRWPASARGARRLDELWISYCVGLGSTRDRILLALSSTDLSCVFSRRIVSAEEVTRVGPTPTCFCTPRRRWARNPGRTVCGYAAMTPAGRLARGDVVFTAMAELRHLLARIPPRAQRTPVPAGAVAYIPWPNAETDRGGPGCTAGCLRMLRQ